MFKMSTLSEMLVQFIIESLVTRILSAEKVEAKKPNQNKTKTEGSL